MCGCNSNFTGRKKKVSNASGCTCKQGEPCNCLSGNKDRFSSFMGKIKKNNRNFVDTKKHGIADEDFFAYNPKHRANFSNFTDSRGFKHQNELEEFDY